MNSLIKKFVVPGIPDEFFIRDKVPMTKSEVRVVTLAKLQLKEAEIVWDIGAGTGSISVEAALMVTKGKVFAIEKSQSALQLMMKNKEKFGCGNLEIISGLAPEVLKGLPNPQKVVVGGSGGRMEEILQRLDEVLLPGGRVVINAIALETLSTALAFYKRATDLNNKNKYSLEVVQLSVAKGETVANLTMMKGYNPIFIITAVKDF